MTPLRQRMIQDLQLRGYSDRTVEASVRAVAQLSQFYHASPDHLSDEQIRQYLLHLSTVQKVARGTHTIARCGIKFFYQQTLGQPWPVLDIARPKGEKKLPVVLSRDEVWRILDAVRIDAYRVCLTTIYACGLRLMEGIRLQVPDIDGDRTLLHIHGKRAKDRYVPLPDATLALLRTHWRTHRNPVWLFPAPLSGAPRPPTHPAFPSTPHASRSRSSSRSLRLDPVRCAPAVRCVSSRAGDDRGPHHGEAFPIGSLPRFSERLRHRRCRPAGLHPGSPAARPQLRRQRARAANDRSHRTMPAAIPVDALSGVPRDRVVPTVEFSSARLKVQEAGSSPPLTGGLRSTADFAAASRGTNLYFVRRRAQTKLEHSCDSAPTFRSSGV